MKREQILRRQAEKQLAKGINEIEPILQKKPNKKIILTKKQKLITFVLPFLVSFALIAILLNYPLMFIFTVGGFFLYISSYAEVGIILFIFLLIFFITLLSAITALIPQLIILRHYHKKNKPIIEEIKSNLQQ